MILKYPPSPYLRLLIIDPSPDFVMSLRNRLQGLQRFDAICHTAATVAEAWEVLALQRFDVILAGLPLPSPGDTAPADLATVFSAMPVIGFSDSGSSLFLHTSLSENVVMVLPRSQLDNRLLEQSIICAVNRAKVCRQLEIAQSALISSGKRFQNIIVNNADGIVVVDMEGRIRFVNPCAERMFGATAEQLIGDPFGYNLIPDGSMEIALRSRDGRQTTVEMRVVRSRWDGGELVYLASLRDISSRKGLERDLTTMKEAAEAANRAKSQFLANMSHEIRTPMNGILGMSELLLSTELTQKQRDYLDMVRQSAASLMDILNDILDFSKIEAGKLELEDVVFDLTETVRSSVNIFTALAQNRGLTLNCSLAQDLPRLVRGDPGRLRQIVVNLVGNAVKFTGAGSVTVQAEAGGLEADGRFRLCVSVRDTGPGIPRQKLDTIFESFTQADNSSTRKYYGTGLGLAICRHLVERMGGTIGVESEERKGSLFRFEVDLKAVAQPGEQARPEAQTGRPGLPPLVILLAEDNMINQLFATEILEQDGHKVLAVGNGREALEALAKNRVDAVLMDIQMPEMDGLEATRRIRAGEVPGTPRDLPIIAMTAHALKGDRERFLAEGMDVYLSKPVGSEEIHAALHEVLNARSKPQQPLQEKPSTGSEILNVAWLLEKARGNREFLKKLFGVFVDQQPQKFEQMRETLDAGDMAQLAFMAHTLKGGAATMGAEVLKDRAFEVEKAAKAADKALAAQEIGAMEFELEQTMLAMKHFMDQ
ncbi:response regulator [Fundidesulfovibrio soli]|uniref:response regulator n=1 Tax=Fundidesulfovibrio soli TaxID=2922716 RepID=UPI001FB01094|nr:response regulator [Fundidesulfovibrio soli]